MTKLLALILVLVLTGCSHTKLLGTVGNEEIYKAEITSFLGPSQTLFLLRNTNSGEVMYLLPAVKK